MSKRQIVYIWPNGRKSIAGGTRTAINLDRPWQKEITINPATCPFCTKPQQEVKKFSELGGWRLLKNLFTPFKFHRLLIPAKCWDLVKLKRLGGAAMIEAALRILFAEIRKYPARKFIVDTHIGYSAGQNIGHLHWHLIEHPFDARATSNMAKGMRKIFSGRPDLALRSSKSGSLNLTIGAGGVRAGQVFFVPTKPVSIKESPTLPRFLATDIYKVIVTYEKKFRSKQGLAPDYSFLLCINRGKFEYAVYTPILNNLGAFDIAAFYDMKWPTTLPWPHEETVRLLKS